MTGEGRLVEVQATAERAPFDRSGLDELLDLAARRDRADRGGAAEAALRCCCLSSRRSG